MTIMAFAMTFAIVATAYHDSFYNPINKIRQWFSQAGKLDKESDIDLEFGERDAIFADSE